MQGFLIVCIRSSVTISAVSKPRNRFFKELMQYSFWVMGLYLPWLRTEVLQSVKRSIPYKHVICTLLTVVPRHRKVHGDLISETKRQLNDFEFPFCHGCSNWSQTPSVCSLFMEASRLYSQRWLTIRSRHFPSVFQTWERNLFLWDLPGRHVLWSSLSFLGQSYLPVTWSPICSPNPFPRYKS